MSEVTAGLLRRLGKLKELAERGERGEKAAAESMLANILKKHGLTLEDIEARPARKWVEVSFVGEHERVLMGQIIRKVTQQRTFYIRRPKKARSRFYVELSPVEQVEVEFMFEVMRAALADEMEKILSAFIFTNKLFGPRADEPAADEKDDSTLEEQARIRQIAHMSMMMSPVNVTKAIKG